MAIDITGPALLAKFVSGGFTPLTVDELIRLSRYLEVLANEPGAEALAILAIAIQEIYRFFLDFEGGVAVELVHDLDALVLSTMPSLREGAPIERVRAALKLRRELLLKIRGYDPRSWSR